MRRAALVFAAVVILVGTVAAQGRLITTVAGNGKRGFCEAGGPAISACLDNARDVALDAVGSLFIADALNRCRALRATTQVDGGRRKAARAWHPPLREVESRQTAAGRARP